MPKIMLLAAMVAALGTVPQPTEAHDRGFGSRHFSGQVGPTLQLRYRGLKFGHVPRLASQRFSQSGLVLKFGDGDSFLRFGHIPLFKPDHFGDRHQHQGPFFGSD